VLTSAVVAMPGSSTSARWNSPLVPRPIDIRFLAFLCCGTQLGLDADQHRVVNSGGEYDVKKGRHGREENRREIYKEVNTWERDW